MKGKSTIIALMILGSGMIIGCQSGGAKKGLVARLASEDVLVRFRAKEELREMGTKAVPLLCEAVEGSDPVLRGRAIDLLTEIDGKDAIETLIGLLACDDDEVSDSAHWALEEIGSPAVPALVAVAPSSDKRLRLNAAAVLLSIGDKSAISRLIELLKDQPTLEKRANVAEVVRALTSYPIYMSKDLSDKKREAEIEKLEEWWDHERRVFEMPKPRVPAQKS